MAVADVQRNAVFRRRQLFQSDNAASVAHRRSRPRTHLSGGHSLHHRHEHTGQRRAAAALHALGNQRVTPGTDGVLMRGITQRHGRWLDHADSVTSWWN